MLRDIETFVREYKKTYEDQYWKSLDWPILEICKGKYKSHTGAEVDKVWAKIALINRVYRTNLHFGKKGSEWKLAEVLADRETKFDDNIHFLSALPFSEKNFDQIIKIHEYFVDVVKRNVTGRIENSFCSKYLNLHFPDSVPIFDQYSYSVSWKIIGRKLYNHGELKPYDKNQNIDYACHCFAVLKLISNLESKNIPVDLKVIDQTLYLSAQPQQL